MAALFSEIGAALLRAARLSARAARRGHRDGQARVARRRCSCAAGEERDLPALAAMHDTGRRRAFRSAAGSRRSFHYALAKKRLLAGLGPPGLRQVEFYVAEEGRVGGRLRGPVRQRERLDAGRGRRPRPGRRAARRHAAGAGRARAVARPPLIRAWWPRDVSRAAAARADRSHRRPRHLHDASAGGCAVPAAAEDVFYWRSDYF